MSRESLTAAKAELFGYLAAANGTPVASLGTVGVNRGYLHEVVTRSGYMTFTVSTGPTDPDFWTLYVRVYASLDADVTKCQADLDLVMPVIDGLVPSGYGPSAWTAVELAPDGKALQVTAAYQCGREDY